MKRIWRRSLVLILVLTLTGCSATAGDGTEPPPTALVQPTSPPSEAVSIEGALGNAEYPIDIASSGLAKLTDGQLEEQAAPGSATTTTIQLSDLVSPGDINADGLEDAAVVAPEAQHDILRDLAGIVASGVAHKVSTKRTRASSSAALSAEVPPWVSAWPKRSLKPCSPGSSAGWPGVASASRSERAPP